MTRLASLGESLINKPNYSYAQSSADVYDPREYSDPCVDNTPGCVAL